jgi:anti-anti-sigma factor
MIKRKIIDDTLIYADEAGEVVSVQETEEGNRIILTVKGQLRTDVVHDIQDELIALTTVGANIVVDLAGVTYLSSTAQHMFLNTQRKMDDMGKGTLVLRKLPAAIYQEFEMTGASELLMIE